MTREEAVRNLLSELINMIDNGSQKDLDRADEICTSIIKLLEQEPCEDAVSRQAVFDLIEHYNSDGLGSVFNGYEQGVKFADAVNKLPSVTPTRKVGEWKKNEHTFWTCSECGLVNKYNRVQYAYCPNCGAEMVESEGKKE